LNRTFAGRQEYCVAKAAVHRATAEDTDPVLPLVRKSTMSRNWLLSIAAVIALFVMGGIAGNVLNLSASPSAPLAAIGAHQMQTGTSANTLPKIQIAVPF
jgi:hypothetical protein